jgi:spore coat polysaccharide biosynthesis protein SpsF (cytidylyltransferase family)
MKSFKQFISESVNISGDFKGNLYINSSQLEPQQFGEEYVADVLWNGSLYRLELITKNGIPSSRDLGEQLQTQYPGAVVQQIYPVVEKNLNIKNSQRYHPAKLDWI